ncbi:MAG: hypothetical protein LBV43_07490 [Prevotella sp.]|jgi:hypothetical protein|nr:hypothetical protein [Prevotella sp.]
MKKIICILLVLPFLWRCAEKKEKPVAYEGNATLELRLKGKRYDSLTLRANFFLDKNKTGDRQFYENKGRSEDGYNWTFLVPDSLRQYGLYCAIEIKSFDLEKEENCVLSFTVKETHRWTSSLAIPLEGKKTVIEGVYIETDTIGTGHASLHYLPNKTIANPRIIYDLFYLNIPEKERYTDFELGFRYPNYGFMPEDDTEYKKTMEEYIELAKKYPNSATLVDRVVPGRGFRSKEDMKRLFNSFSKETRGKYFEEHPYYKESFYAPAKHIDINKLKLVNSRTGEAEPVIADKSIPTLVILSCIGLESHDKVMPFLKEEVGDKTTPFELVFINVDYDNNERWKKLLEEEQIPWRSLNVKESDYWALSDTYFYWNVFSVLYAKDGKIKVLYRRENHDKLGEIIENVKTLNS